DSCPARSPRPAFIAAPGPRRARIDALEIAAVSGCARRRSDDPEMVATWTSRLRWPLAGVRSGAAASRPGTSCGSRLGVYRAERGQDRRRLFPALSLRRRSSAGGARRLMRPGFYVVAEARQRAEQDRGEHRRRVRVRLGTRRVVSRSWFPVTKPGEHASAPTTAVATP